MDRVCTVDIHLRVEPAEMHLEMQAGGCPVRWPLHHRVRQRQEERRGQPRLGTWQDEGVQEKGWSEDGRNAAGLFPTCCKLTQFSK